MNEVERYLARSGWLWVAGCDHLGAAPFVLPALHRESLTKITMEA